MLSYIQFKEAHVSQVFRRLWDLGWLDIDILYLLLFLVGGLVDLEPGVFLLHNDDILELIVFAVVEPVGDDYLVLSADGFEQVDEFLRDIVEDEFPASGFQAVVL